MQGAATAESYAEHGYLVVRDVFSRAEIDPLLSEATRICRGELGPLEGLESVSGRDTDEAVLGRYIACHVAHKISPRFRRLLHDERVVDVARALIGPNVKCVHSVLFIKSPGEPGNAWHQDEFFIPSRDRSITTAWVALDDATVENGCLHLIPGSHRAGVLYPMRRHHDPDLDRAEEAHGFPYSPEDAVAVELEAGSIVFFNGYLLHGSYPNRSESRFRRSVQFVYMSAESLLPWDQVTRGPTTRDYRDIIMVSGTDPYAYKGVEDISRAYCARAARHPRISPRRPSTQNGTPHESGPVSMTHEIPDAERDLRVQLAGLFRISAHLGWEDSFNTHYTARVPGTDPPRFLMNPYGVRFDEMKASDLVTVDLDGDVLEETEYPVNEAGFVIHSAIHRDRHDALCVIHTHTHAGMAVAAMAHGLLPIGIFALGFHERVSYHDFEGGSGRHNMSERERLAASLGPTNNAMIMRNHGLLTVGASVPEAFVWMFRLNRACEVQVLTHGARGEYVMPSAEAAANTATATLDFVSAYGSGEPGEAEFNAFLRVVERQDESFRG